MMKVLPALTVHPNVLQTAGNVNLLLRDLSNLASVQASWQRSIRLHGGYWLGRFRVEELTQKELRQMYNTWLGCHLREKTSGITWEGMIYEMTLHDGMSRRVSLEEVSNHVRGGYRQLILNGGFENHNGFSFDNWSIVVAGTDSIALETTNPAVGTRCVRITYGNNGNTYIYQTITVEARTLYRLRFNTRGSGSVAGRYRIRDNSNGVDIIAVTNTGITAARWETVEKEIVTPTNCTSITIYFYAPTALASVYFDNAFLHKLVNSKEVTSLTTAVENAQSITAYGRKEVILDGFEIQPDAATAAEKHLNLTVWPTTKRAPSSSQKTALDVLVAGYIFTTKWVYASSIQQYGSETAANTLVDNLLQLCPYVNQRIVKSNTTLLQLPIDKHLTVREALNHITQIDNDKSDGFWRLYMTASRTAVYEEMSAAPLFAIANGQFVHARANRAPVTNPYIITPGVVRDLDDPTLSKRANPFFTDARDFLLDEVSVGPNGVSWSEG
ncbi:MAG: hypothetical protein KF770_08580 [Anaerolineae bacterium]|nr:hypothetical protein [Anaerolineae bacterium]